MYPRYVQPKMFGYVDLNSDEIEVPKIGIIKNCGCQNMLDEYYIEINQEKRAIKIILKILIHEYYKPGSIGYFKAKKNFEKLCLK